MEKNKIKKKKKGGFLLTIENLRKAYTTFLLPKNLSRTISFRIFPKSNYREILDRWFDEISEIKYLHLRDIYEEFKNGALNLFRDSELGYHNLYKGKRRFENYKKDYKILSAKIEEGIRTEITSTLNSFITNTKKAFDENKRLLEKIKSQDLQYEERELFQSKIDDYKSLIINNYQNWKKAKELTLEINNIISQINKERNLNKIKPLRRLKRLPSFPLLEKYPDFESFQRRNRLEFNLENFKNKIKSLLNEFKNKYLNKNKNSFDENTIRSYLEKESKILSKKLQYRKKKSTFFKDRFLYWYSQRGGNQKPVGEIIESLKYKLEKQEKHLFKKPFDTQGRNKFFNTLFFLTEILYVSQLSEDKQQEALNEINNEITKIKSEFLKGKPIKDSFTISGFSWNKSKSPKPQKAGTLILNYTDNNKIKLGIALGTSAKPFCLKEDHPKEFGYIILTGGSRKKSIYEPKKYEVKEGHLETNQDPYSCYFWLHHGKSYLRRILFHKDWGFLSNSLNKFFPANARLKRIKNKPGDKFEYYVDITFTYEGETEFFNKEYIQNKIQYILGIDRGEKYPIAYAILDKTNKEIIDKGILGEKFSEILSRLNKLRKKRRIRNKILNTQETILHQSISKILKILSKYPSIIVIENLNKGFGKEKSLIAKRVYRKIEKFLELSLNYANLPFRYLIKFINPKDTSIICPNCEFNFNEEVKRKILENLTSGNFKSLVERGDINFIERKFKIKDLELNLPEKWVIYSDKYPKEIKLTEIKDLFDKEEFEESRKLFQTLTPRIDRDNFKCLRCGHEENADIIGAINIAKRGLNLIIK